MKKKSVKAIMFTIAVFVFVTTKAHFVYATNEISSKEAAKKTEPAPQATQETIVGKPAVVSYLLSDKSWHVTYDVKGQKLRYENVIDEATAKSIISDTDIISILVTGEKVELVKLEK